jgi:hypothetical protein
MDSVPEGRANTGPPCPGRIEVKPARKYFIIESNRLVLDMYDE